MTGELSQDEIDALLAGVDAGESKASKAFDEALENFENYLTANIASAQFHINARHFFGVMYNYGVWCDLEKANYWFVKAAEQGDTDAQYELGLMYEKGRGVPKDYAKAAEWFSKAAAQGNTEAMDSLAKVELALE